MSKLARIVDAISYYAGYVAGWMVVGIMLLTMAEVISRYVLRNPIMLADEFGGYSYAAISLLGLAYTMREGRHIRIQFVVTRLPAKVSNWLRVFTLAAACTYAIVASQVSYGFIFDAFDRNIRSASHLMTPLGWPQIALPVGFILLSIALLLELFRAIGNLRAGIETERIAAEKAEGSGL